MVSTLSTLLLGLFLTVHIFYPRDRKPHDKMFMLRMAFINAVTIAHSVYLLSFGIFGSGYPSVWDHGKIVRVVSLLLDFVFRIGLFCWYMNNCLFQERHNGQDILLVEEVGQRKESRDSESFLSTADFPRSFANMTAIENSEVVSGRLKLYIGHDNLHVEERKENSDSSLSDYESYIHFLEPYEESAAKENSELVW